MSARIEEWMKLRADEGKPDRVCIRFGLKNMLAEHMGDVASTVTAAQLVTAYARLRARISKYGRPVAVTTHQDAVVWTKAFFASLKERGLIRTDPAVDIKLIGKRNRRKQQIETMTELHAFRNRAFELAEAGDRVALGVLLSLYNGPRSGEVRSIEARHVDKTAGDRLVIDGTKTANARRSIRVCEPRLWKLLEAAADAASAPDERLVPHVQTTLLERVKTIGRDIGLPADVANRLTFHSLRGMAASLATRGDAAGRAIAEMLGQSSEKITRAHYSTPASQNAAAAQASFRVLQGGNVGNGMNVIGSQANDATVTSENNSVNKVAK